MNTMELFTAIGTYGVALLSGGFATYAYMAYKRDREEIYRTMSDNDSYQQRENERITEDLRNEIQELGRTLDAQVDDIYDHIDKESNSLSSRIDGVYSELENIED